MSEYNFIKADGFDEAIVGACFKSERLIYSKPAMAHILMENDGMSSEDAWEYLEYNVFDAYVGEHTPIYMDYMTQEDVQDLFYGPK